MWLFIIQTIQSITYKSVFKFKSNRYGKANQYPIEITE